MPVRFAAAVLAFAILMGPVRAAADDVRLETRHFVFVHNGKAGGLAGRLAKTAEDRRHYIRYMLGLPVESGEKVEVRIAVNEDEMQAMTGSEGRVERWIAGLTFHGSNLIVMSARGNEYFKASDTFVHELAHLYLDEAVGNRFVPRWFHEGFAMMAASEDMGERMHAVLAATATGSLIPLSELEHSFPSREPAVHLAYAESMFFVRYLQRASSSGGVRDLIDDLRAGMPFRAAFQSTWRTTPEKMFEDFEDSFSRFDSVVAFITSATLLWAITVGIFVFVYLRKKKMARQRVQMWELEEELQRERIMRVMADQMNSTDGDGSAVKPEEEIN